MKSLSSIASKTLFRAGVPSGAGLVLMTALAVLSGCKQEAASTPARPVPERVDPLPVDLGHSHAHRAV